MIHAADTRRLGGYKEANVFTQIAQMIKDDYRGHHSASAPLPVGYGLCVGHVSLQPLQSHLGDLVTKVVPRDWRLHELETCVRRCFIAHSLLVFVAKDYYALRPLNYYSVPLRTSAAIHCCF